MSAGDAAVLVTGSDSGRTELLLDTVGPAVAVVLACAGVVGHALDLTVLTQVSSAWPAMTPGTSLGLLVGAVAVTTAVRDRGPRARRIRAVSSVLLVVLSVALILRQVAGESTGLVAGALSTIGLATFEGIPGSAPTTGVSLLLVGVACLPFPFGGRERPLASALALSVASMAYVALLGYALGIAELYTTWDLADGVGMAVHTATALLLLSVTLLERWHSQLEQVAGAEGWGLSRVLLVALAGGGLLSVLIISPGTRRVSSIAASLIIAGATTVMYVAITNSWEQIAHAQRMTRSAETARTRFVTAVSHRMRTPLTTVRGIAEVLDAHGEELVPERRHELLARLAAAASALDQTLTGLLDLSMHRRGDDPEERGVVRLDEVVRGAVRDAPLDSSLIVLELDELEGRVQARRLSDAVVELLRNVAVHAPDATVVEVRLSVTSTTVELVVEDDGPGLGELDPEVVFDAFERGTADDHSPHTGVGLARVRLFAELHAGVATAEESGLGGLAIRVQLPREALAVDG